MPARMPSYEGRNRRAVNLLKTIYFDYPEWTICRVEFLPATWMKYRDDLETLVLAHPRIFPGYEKGSVEFDRIDNPLYELGSHEDCWGVVWENITRGMDSVPLGHPLSDWAKLGDYSPPDPLTDDLFGKRDWNQVERWFDETRDRGDLVTAYGLPHGFMYMRLYYLRSFENLMIDMGANDPRLWKLIEMVERYNSAVIQKCLELGAEYMCFGDDLGLQSALPMSPAMWRRFIKPSYERMFRPCREADVPIYLHTDGHVLEIIPDLIEAGVRVLNPQFRSNGLKGLREIAKGRVALDQDLDRQLFPFATRGQLEDHICEVYEELQMPEGGLMLLAECGPDVPLESIDLICATFERLCNPPDPLEVR